MAHIIEIHGQLSYDQLKGSCGVLMEYGGEQQIDQEKKQADDEKMRHKKFLYEAAKQLSD